MRGRVAVAGTGGIGLKHLRALAALPGARPIAVPRRPGRVRELGRLGFEAAASLADAADRGATACIVATDTARHADDASAALGLGMDVLVEKPAATDAASARRLWWRARRRRRGLWVGCVLRFSESLGRLRALLPRLGPLHHVRIECQSYLPDWRPGRPYRRSYSSRSGEGGVLLDLIHEVDYAGWLFGWPAEVWGEVRNLGRLGIASDESADLLWRLPGGGSVAIHLDYLTRPTRRGLTAAGRNGTLRWDATAGTVEARIRGEREHRFTSAQSREALYVAQARAFLGAAAGRADSRLATGEDGVRALAVCDAARRASAEGRRRAVAAP